MPHREPAVCVDCLDRPTVAILDPGSGRELRRVDHRAVATAKIGAILVNINSAYRIHELAYVIKQSGLRAMVAMTGIKTSDYRAMVDEVAHDCPTLERTICPTWRTGPTSSRLGRILQWMRWVGGWLR